MHGAYVDPCTDGGSGHIEQQPRQPRPYRVTITLPGSPGAGGCRVDHIDAVVVDEHDRGHRGAAGQRGVQVSKPGVAAVMHHCVDPASGQPHRPGGQIRSDSAVLPFQAGVDPDRGPPASQDPQSVHTPKV